MQEVWFRETKTKEDRESVKQDLALAYRAFRKLEEILKSKLKEPSSDYNNSNWAYMQADTVGYNRALKEVLKLIKQEG